MTTSSRGPGVQLPVVAERANGEARELRIGQQPRDERLAHLAGRAGDQDSGLVRCASEACSFDSARREAFFSKTRSTMTAARMTPPATTFCHSDLPTRFTALKVICMMPAPMRTPNTEPRPPSSEQPPSTAAATACSSYAEPSDGVALGRYAT